MDPLDQDPEQFPEFEQFVRKTNYVPTELRVPHVPDWIRKDPKLMQTWNEYWAKAKADWNAIMEQSNRDKERR